MRPRLTSFINAAGPTDENLHFARFEKLSAGSIEELTDLAADARTLADEHADALSRDAYGDGMFWYDLFLVISSSAVSYQKAAGEPLKSDQAKDLVETLVHMARYTTILEGDITKRNREALGNVLWAVRDVQLIEEARSLGDALGANVPAFVESTIQAVAEDSE